MNSDIIIVGGGILGLAHAYHLIDKGMKITMLEKNSPLQGASVRNFGQIVPSGFSTKWQKFGIKSTEIYQKIHEEYGLHLRQEGSLYIASDDDELLLLQELNHINKQNNYPSSLLSPEDCIEHSPHINSAYVKGGLLFEQEWVADPVMTLHNLTQYLSEVKKMDYRPSCRVLGYQNKGNEIQLLTNQGELYCKKLIFCPGNDLEFYPIASSVFHSIQSVKLQMIELRPEKRAHVKGSLLTGRTIRRYESFQECPSYQGIIQKQRTDDDLSKYGIHLLFKETVEGNLIVGDSHEYALYPEKDRLYPYLTNNSINQLILEEMKKIMCIENYSIVKTWNGMYTQSIDEDILQMKLDENIHMISAIGGKGMTASLGWAGENVDQILAQ